MDICTQFHIELKYHLMDIYFRISETSQTLFLPEFHQTLISQIIGYIPMGQLGAYCSDN